MVCHVLNRAAGRRTLFHEDSDYAAFERVLLDAHDRIPLRILAYCVMPNHFHFVFWPRARHDSDVSEFMRWLTLTHAQRYHAHNETSGTGPVYQGRFKSFPVQSDTHLHTVARYVERNPVRANLVSSADQWRWSSLWRLMHGSPDEASLISEWPTTSGKRPRNWIDLVNAPQTEEELNAVRRCITRGQPYGKPGWTKKTTARLGLQSTFRKPGRPPRK